MIPRSSISLYAFWIVFGLIDRSVANCRTDGSQSPGLSAPEVISRTIWSRICAVIGWRLV